MLQVSRGLIHKKQKEHIVDIDAADANNELAVVEYVEDIYKFYKLIEVCQYFGLFRFAFWGYCVYLNMQAKYDRVRATFKTTWTPSLR